MKVKDGERIRQLDFEHNGTQYRFKYDKLEQLNKYGVYETICEIPLSHTTYANDKEIIEFVCRQSLYIFSQGIVVGEKNKARAIREMLGIKE